MSSVLNLIDPELLKPTPITSSEINDRIDQRDVYPIQDMSPDRLVSPGQATDINGFYELVNKVIQFKLEKDGEEKKVLFREDFPDDPDDLNNEIITFGIQKRLPGIAEQTPNPLKRNALRMRKPILREVRTDNENHKYRVFVKGQWFDNFVQFCCWARENKIANRRALWFEEMMLEYEWFFQASGIVRLRYEGRAADTFDEVQERKVVGRPMTWLVTTEKLIVTHERILDELAVRTHAMTRRR